MVVDFGALADTLINSTRERRIKRNIGENAASIADEIARNGFYEDHDLGFRVSVDRGSDDPGNKVSTDKGGDRGK
jgi:hypothetical protein